MAKNQQRQELGTCFMELPRLVKYREGCWCGNVFFPLKQKMEGNKDIACIYPLVTGILGGGRPRAHPNFWSYKVGPGTGYSNFFAPLLILILISCVFFPCFDTEMVNFVLIQNSFWIFMFTMSTSIVFRIGSHGSWSPQIKLKQLEWKNLPSILHFSFWIPPKKRFSK